MHSNVVSAHNVRADSVQGMHEVTSAQTMAELVSSMGFGHEPAVSVHELVDGHQKQPGVMGAVHVVQVVKEPQFATGAHVMAS